MTEQRDVGLKRLHPLHRLTRPDGEEATTRHDKEPNTRRKPGHMLDRRGFPHIPQVDDRPRRGGEEQSARQSATKLSGVNIVKEVDAPDTEGSFRSFADDGCAVSALIRMIGVVMCENDVSPRLSRQRWQVDGAAKISCTKRVNQHTNALPLHIQAGMAMVAEPDVAGAHG